MSQLRLQQPNRPLRTAPLRAVQQTRSQGQPGAVPVVTIGFGLLAILLLQLLITIATSAGVYEISALKAEKRNLVESTQILGAQVDSLSSPQNLSNAAAQLGMIANANPVFLSVQDQKVSGKPMAALAGYQNRISSNLVPNAELQTQTSASDLAALTGTATVSNAENANVATSSKAVGQVSSTKSRIPASPTN